MGHMAEVKRGYFEDSCNYCMKGEKLESVMIEICVLRVSTLYLLKDQTYTGRCIAALNRHEAELCNLDKETLHLLSEDVSSAACAIKNAFNPDKINYAVYGDLVPHLHFHLVPKYEGGHCWGKPFDANPQKIVLLSEEEYNESIEKIKRHLK